VLAYREQLLEEEVVLACREQQWEMEEEACMEQV
jgi:hypothetical protein